MLLDRLLRILGGAIRHRHGAVERGEIDIDFPGLPCRTSPRDKPDRVQVDRPVWLDGRRTTDRRAGERALDLDQQEISLAQAIGTVADRLERIDPQHVPLPQSVGQLADRLLGANGNHIARSQTVPRKRDHMKPLDHQNVGRFDDVRRQGDFAQFARHRSMRERGIADHAIGDAVGQRMATRSDPDRRDRHQNQSAAEARNELVHVES